MKDLKQRTFNNVVYNVIAKGFTVIFQGVASIILTRTLLPSDYGVVGFAMIFVGFLGQINDLGVNSAIVQRRELDERALYTGFVMRFGMAAALYMSTFVLSGFSTYFFDNSAVVNVIRVLSLTFLFGSFSFLPSTLLRRELDYKKNSLSSICHSITNSTLSVVLALRDDRKTASEWIDSAADQLCPKRFCSRSQWPSVGANASFLGSTVLT